MWKFPRQFIDADTEKIRLFLDSEVVSYQEVVELWGNDATFRAEFTTAILNSPFEAFFWECPPVMSSTVDRDFEFVLVNAPALVQLHADPKPFESHFDSSASSPVLVFPNLGGDAILVVPTPIAALDCYAHLARFLSGAPRSQIDAFWQRAGELVSEKISGQPMWLSTSGLGVSWLHLRLDSRAKYYRYQPYTVVR